MIDEKYNELELIIFVSQGLTLSTASLVKLFIATTLSISFAKGYNTISNNILFITMQEEALK